MNLSLWHEAHWTSLISTLSASAPLCSVWHISHDTSPKFGPSVTTALWAVRTGPPKVWQLMQFAVFSDAVNTAATQPVGPLS